MMTGVWKLKTWALLLAVVLTVAVACQADEPVVDTGPSEADIERIVKSAVAGSGDQLTAADVQKIVSDSAGGQLTAADVQRIVRDSVAGQLTASDVQQIVNASTSGQLSAADVQRIVQASTGGQLTASDVQKIVNASAAGQLTTGDVQKIISESVSEAVEEAKKATAAAEAAGMAAKAAGVAAEAAAMDAQKALAGVELQKELVAAVTAPAPLEFNEAPELAQLVLGGKLPPVEERLPSVPLVIPVFDEIGKYGGDLRAGFTSRSVCNMERYARSTLFRFNTDASAIIPNLAQSLEISPDGLVTTVKLRPGTKWSDGAPFTVDNFVYWLDDYENNDELRPGRISSYLRGINEEDDGTLVKVDDYTVQYVYPAPMTSMAVRLTNPCSFSTFAPSHYVQQFHKDYNSNAEAMAKEAGFETWVQWYTANDGPNENPEVPVLNAWYPTGTVTKDDVVVFKRNPYYVGVDAEGNQLPYIDTMTHFHIPGDQERLNLMVLAGEMDFQAFGINNEDLPLFKQGEEDGGYRLIGHPVARGIWDGMYINFSLEGKMGDLLRNVDFRRALSVAIDRDAINQNSYLGLGEARQVVPLKASPFYPGDEAAFAWTQYDVDLANMMLDEILPDKDSEGFRTFSDGERVVVLLDAWNQINNSSSLQVPQYWEAVGIKTEYGGALGGEQGGTVIRDRVQQNENMFMMYVINAAHPFVQNSYTSPTAWWSFSGPAYGSYHCKCHPEDDPGMMPTGEMQELIDLHLRGTTVPESEQVELGKEIFRRWAEDVYGIGLVGNVPRYAAVKNGLRNVPTSWMGGATERSPSTAFLEQFYWAR
jgi:peptide/nickel transport system substrate-binding protein